MIDIKAIRKKSENGGELKRLRTHVINAVNTAADNGQGSTSVLCSVGKEIVWRREVFKIIIEDLKKDGFNAYERSNPASQETWLYIDWVEPYADTDSVKLPESCPEVAPELPQVCQNCKWFLHGLKKCQLKDVEICLDPACIGCGLYESEE